MKTLGRFFPAHADRAAQTVQIIQVNLTSENPQPIVPGQKLEARSIASASYASTILIDTRLLRHLHGAWSL